MESPQPVEIVIRGITKAGKKFRPSDWAERLAALLSSMGTDHRMRYSPLVQPLSRAGVRCVVIQRALEQEDPQLFRFLLDFARDNDLEVLDGRKSPRD